jgi:hypothetical protein
MSYVHSPRILGAMPRRRHAEIGPHLLAPSHAIVPLGSASLAPSGMSEPTKRLIMVALVVLGLLFLVWWFGQRGAPRANTGGGGKLMTRNEALGRASTADLAKKLYERLDTKGGASPATLRSLQRYAKR